MCYNVYKYKASTALADFQDLTKNLENRYSSVKESKYANVTTFLIIDKSKQRAYKVSVCDYELLHKQNPKMYRKPKAGCRYMDNILRKLSFPNGYKK